MKLKKYLPLVGGLVVLVALGYVALMLWQRRTAQQAEAEAQPDALGMWPTSFGRGRLGGGEMSSAPVQSSTPTKRAIDDPGFIRTRGPGGFFENEIRGPVAGQPRGTPPPYRLPPKTGPKPQPPGTTPGKPPEIVRPVGAIENVPSGARPSDAASYDDGRKIAIYVN